MLLILIPILWLIIATVCLSICIMAARGDTSSEPDSDRAPLPTYKLAPAHAAPELLLQDTRISSRRVLTGRGAR
jgi:hypothetical protein